MNTTVLYNEMEKIRADENSMVVEQEFANNVMEILFNSNNIKKDIKEYCNEILNECEYDILMYEAEEVLKLL